jgi:hypothetical protein
LRGQLSDQLRELNFCRVRLSELRQAFDEGEPDASPASLEHEELSDQHARPGPVRHLFPAGCNKLNEAITHFAGPLTQEDCLHFDQHVQALIQQQFRALIHICMTPANLLKNVQAAMEDEVARSVEARLGPTDTAALFLEHFNTDAEGVDALLTAFDEAAPDLAGVKSGQTGKELCVFAVPPGESGDRIKALARQAMPDVPWTFAISLDDIIVYREAPQLPISELAQLGPLPQEAYRQMTAIEHFTPHTRTDIAFCEVARAP